MLGSPGDLEPATGPMGEQELGVRSVAVNLTGSRVAGVGTEGDRLLVTDVRDPRAT